MPFAAQSGTSSCSTASQENELPIQRMRMTNMILMSFKPVLAYSAVGDKGYREMDGILHLRYYDLTHFLYFRLRYIEIQFVMHLHDHLRLEVLFFQSPMDGHHRYLDDIRRRTLYRCIDGIPLRE